MTQAHFKPLYGHLCLFTLAKAKIMGQGSSLPYPMEILGDLQSYRAKSVDATEGEELRLIQPSTRRVGKVK